MLKLIIAPTCTAKVKGKLPDADGHLVDFDFDLVCDRADAPELRAMLSADKPTADVLAPKVKGWRRVLDDAGHDVPFNADNLQRLLKVGGMASLCWAFYVEACSARGAEKN
jgi:hypothetical protein